MSTRQNNSKLYSMLFVMVFMTLTSCGDSAKFEVSDRSSLSTENFKHNDAIELDFTSEIGLDPEGNDCDSLVSRPNPGIEYSGREIIVAEHFSFSPKSSDPGSEWCMKPADEFLGHEV